MKKKEKRHIHKIKGGDPCPDCGYQEGYCEDCGKLFDKSSDSKRWKIQ